MPFRARNRGLFRAGSGNSGSVIDLMTLVTDHIDYSVAAHGNASFPFAQTAEIGSLVFQGTDTANGLGLTTVNGLRCLGNFGGFLSDRGTVGSTITNYSKANPCFVGAVYVLTGGTSVSQTVLGTASTGRLRHGLNGGVGAQLQGPSATISGGTGTNAKAQVALGVMDNTSSELWLDGSLVASGSIGNGGLPSGRVSGITAANLVLCELIIGNGHPAAASIKQWMAQKKTKWDTV